MDWIFTIAILIVVVILGFMFFIFMPRPIVFFDPDIEELNNFKPIHDEIKKEVDAVEKDPIIPIYGDGIVFDERFPKIYELLTKLPNVRYAGIINLKPKFEQKQQYGFARNANYTLRYFYTINHSATNKSGIWVDGAKKFFYKGDWVCADVSREHSLFNKYRYESTAVLFVDIDRKLSIPQGNSPNTELMNDEILRMFL